jgi:hypothetical protein
MKVAYAPFTVLADQRRCELSILSGGFRVSMTGEEAGALWVELGTALKQLYADRPEKCPPESATELPKQSLEDSAEVLGAQLPAQTAFRRLVRDTFERRRGSR